MFRTIVIGFDGSSQALDALALGQELATAETKVVVCCVHPPEGFGFRVSASGDVSLRSEAERRLHGARSRLGDRPHTEFVIRTALSTGAGLHDGAEQRGADLLIVGSSHRGTVGRMVLGSVTRQALRAAPCAVAVAPPSLHLREEPRIEQIGVAFDGGPESRVALESASRLARESRACLRLLTVVDVGRHRRMGQRARRARHPGGDAGDRHVTPARGAAGAARGARRDDGGARR